MPALHRWLPVANSDGFTGAVPAPCFWGQTFHEWPLHSIPHSSWAREYYKEQRAQGKSRNAAMRALAFKWIRVLFHCWKERKLTTN
jgi:hypothetical protein